MNAREIGELLENICGGSAVPERLKEIVAKFAKRKCAVCPNDMTISDVVTCTILYDMERSAETRPKVGRPRKKEPNG